MRRPGDSRPLPAPYPPRPILFIGRSKSTQRLYDAEARLTTAVHAVALQHQLLDQRTPAQDAGYWRLDVPQALVSALESFEPPAAASAAIAYLTQFGFRVTDPDGQPVAFAPELEHAQRR